jgi:hypothetical protein
MTLVVLTVIIIGLLIAVLAIYLFVIGGLLKRTAENLGDCLQNVRMIAGQAQVIGPGVTRLNKIGGDLLGAMPLLIEGADGVTAKLAPSAATTNAPAKAAPNAAKAAPAGSVAAAPEVVRVDGGYLDSATGVGYMDV